MTIFDSDLVTWREGHSFKIPPKPNLQQHSWNQDSTRHLPLSLSVLHPTFTALFPQHPAPCHHHHIIVHIPFPRQNHPCSRRSFGDPVPAPFPHTRLLTLSGSMPIFLPSFSRFLTTDLTWHVFTSRFPQQPPRHPSLDPSHLLSHRILLRCSME